MSTTTFRVLLTGANGQLGQDLQATLAGRVPDGGDAESAVQRSVGLPEAPVEVLATDIGTLDVSDRDEVLAATSSFRPDLVLHAGASTAVDACESEVDTAFAVNALGTRNVVEAARRVGAHVVYVSTDYVFDGTSDRPYVEWDTPNPQSVYGRSKHGGELEALGLGGPHVTVARTAWVSGAHGANMVKTVLRLAVDSRSGPLRFVDDQRGTPTFTADLAPALVRLGLERRPGIVHVTNRGETTWFDFARAVLGAAGLDPDLVVPIATSELDPPRPAPRPANSCLDNSVLRLAGLAELPDWTSSLTRLVAALPVIAGRA
jgi:dTDP-4-dehydrorhamnose reductase